MDKTRYTCVFCLPLQIQAFCLNMVSQPQPNMLISSKQVITVNIKGSSDENLWLLSHCW